LDVEEFIKDHPELYHMAAAGSWEQIQHHGLLSTTALLDRYRVTGERRRLLESCRRGKSEPITHPDTGETACIRDNRPIYPKVLAKKLPATMEPEDWYRLLNQHVFFWLCEDDLRGFLDTYGDTEHDVITVSTRRLVDRDYDRITITPFNTGSAHHQNEYERDRDTFSPIHEFDIDRWRKRIRHRPPIVELAVAHEVQRVEEVAALAQRRHGRYDVRETLWPVEHADEANVASTSRDRLT